MSIYLSMPTSDGPQWMFFLLPIVALLLVYEGSKRLVNYIKHHKRNRPSTEITE
jgi:hypothetical protein